ncbi:MAG TPA: TolC family protein [Pirellulales bacterium]|jgi:cobalt-zinc-cadmium efflux system outer membrane protein|nr:TolC family protein [Pirellulales bacterium]
MINRRWGFLSIIVLAGCQSAPPVAQPLSVSQPPQLSTVAIPPPQSIRADAMRAAADDSVRLASFDSPGKTEIQIRMPQLAQADQAATSAAELSAGPPYPTVPEPVSPLALPIASRAITIDEALAIALAQNPDLVVNRQDVAVAEAQRVTANTYPFNPTFESQIQAADNFGLAQHIRQSYSLLQEIETGGKGGFRRGQANAGVQRTEWELRGRELDLAVDVYRKFQAVLLARQKLDLARETAALNIQLANNARPLLQAAKVTGADVVIAEQEALDSRQAEAIAESELRMARLELRSSLGIAEELQLEPSGGLRLPQQPASASLNTLVQAALATRPEIFAKTAALQQADAAVGLAIANQKADVTFGPAMEIDENKTFFIGATLQVPLQVYNKKEGEVLQAEAERAKAAAELEQSRLKVKMAVLAAWQQYEDARRLAAALANDTLPASERHLQDAEKLLAVGQIDLLKLVELRRRHLAARQQLLDAQNQMVLRQLDLETLSGRLLPTEKAPSESPLPTPSPVPGQPEPRKP